MIRCITNDKEVLYASKCDEKTTRKLSRAGSLLCPNCKNIVRFNKGNQKRPYFSHVPDTDCVVTNYENETKEHILGKELLFKWLQNKFPNANIELEVYIPETKQIADILLTHSIEETAKEARWAFEFQHSPLQSREWEERHNLYQSANIHDFWILDAGAFLKYSKAKGAENARLRHDLETSIFKNTGFCYFLNLETQEMIIDFSFQKKKIFQDVRGKRFPNEYTFHKPIAHTCNLNEILFSYNSEFNYSAMAYENIKKEASEKVDLQIKRFQRVKEEKLEAELQQRALEKITYAQRLYGEDFKTLVSSFMKRNKEKVKEDVRKLSEEEFFSTYDEYLQKIQSNNTEVEHWKNTDNINKKILYLQHSAELTYEIAFLEKQGERSLENYLTEHFSRALDMVNYVLNKYDKILTTLESRKPEFMLIKLRKIKYFLDPNKSNPTKFDYAYRYFQCESKEQIDEFMIKIQEELTPKFFR
ncbi:competence protein CoiA family protein [Bacillus sp. TL12]|uniref:competence protein CoiA n=1 Tax=Bacillus sp. TL12 TaxID=2894756 RepID=UPI001F51BB6D|nr:competence protein CoiA family protein [Bacillus sp. TL12]MCI0764793.1 hypothetical protein [Bacillus sp. TL12]